MSEDQSESDEGAVQPGFVPRTLKSIADYVRENDWTTRVEEKRGKFLDIYSLCDTQHKGDLTAMKEAYHLLVPQRSWDKPQYKSMLADITLLHRLECIFGPVIVRHYVLPDDGARATA